MSILPNLQPLPADIRHSTRAVVWKAETREGKPTKVPYIAHRPAEKAAVDNPTTWTTFAVAYDAVADGKADGAGVVLGEGIVGIDLDHCRHPETGVISDAALAVIRELDSYTEVSPSQTGIHVLVKGTLPPGRRRTNGLELYSDLRYFTVTGHHVEWTPREIHERTAELAALHARLFGTEPPPSSSRPVQTTASLDDAGLLVKASVARNGATFAALWAGDTSAYQGDESAADLALSNLLAFWTGRDPVWMDRLFRQSGLMRAKWDSRRGQSTYGADTIARALRDCGETFTPASDSIELEIDEPPAPARIHAAAWPTLADAALIGPFGDFVRAVSPHTEADPVGLLAHALVLFGNLIGRRPQVAVGDDLHNLNENILIIGDTSTGRKGMALNAAKAVLADVDPPWMHARVVAGLSSGEGLIYAVRDPQVADDGEVVDGGVADKRLAVIETEFAKVLRVSRRENNTLSTTLRQCWDDGTLRVMTRHSPLAATAAHVSVIGHITPLELRQELRTTDMASGFINRFVLVLVKRRQLLPVGGRIDATTRARLVAQFTAGAAAAREVDILTRDANALTHWTEVYGHLTRSRLGLVGAICNRAPAHVLRLAALYALAEGSDTIRRPHQEAALALWAYAEASTTFIFGQRVGHRLANYLLELLRTESTGMTRKQIRDALGRNRHADEISEALQLLADLGLATRILEPASGPGRRTERWVAEMSTT